MENKTKKMNWNEQQLDLLKRLNFSFDVEGELTHEQCMEIQGTVGDHLMAHGLESYRGDYRANDIGNLCYSIIDGFSSREGE